MQKCPQYQVQGKEKNIKTCTLYHYNFMIKKKITAQKITERKHQTEGSLVVRLHIISIFFIVYLTAGLTSSLFSGLCWNVTSSRPSLTSSPKTAEPCLSVPYSVLFSSLKSTAFSMYLIPQSLSVPHCQVHEACLPNT